MPDIAYPIAGSHNLPMAVLSVAISVTASYTAFSLAGQAKAGELRPRWIWMSGAALSMGAGIWAMHFIAMVAFRLPVPVSHDGPTTLLSVLIAVLGSLAAFSILSWRGPGRLRLVTSGLLLGLSSAGMHVVGMGALRTEALMHHNPLYGGLAFLLAMAASVASVWCKFRLSVRSATAHTLFRIALGGGFGLAASAAHYISVSGLHFSLTRQVPAVRPGAGLWTASILGISVLLILGLTLLTAMLNQKARRQISNVLESMSDAFVAVDRQWRYTYLNSAAGHLLRRRPEDLLGKQLWAEFPTLTGTRFYSECHGVMKSGLPAHFTSYSAMMEAWLEVSLHPSPEGLSIFFRDVTHDVQFRRLQESLVANVSHELRGPLASLTAVTEALHDHLIPEAERDRYLSAMRTELLRLRRLTDDLLEFSRMEAGVAPVHCQALNLAPLFEEVRDTWAPRLAAAGLHFDVALPAVRVSADYDRVQQVIANLLDNACKFTPPGGGVRLWAALEQGRLRICVADSGQGIAPENLPRIWDHFYTEDTARTRSAGGGAGLGLPMVKLLVERMGGEVQVRSRLGQGSVFSFTLPPADDQVSEVG